MSKKLITAIVLLLILMSPAFTAYDYDIVMPVNSSGFGYKDLETWKSVLPVQVKVTGQILSPQIGTWRIQITVNDGTVFDKLGIAAGQSFTQEFKAGRESRIQVYAWWSENNTTTLKMHAKGCVHTIVGCIG